MLMEIAAEEFNHMEMISVTIQMLKGENVSDKPSDFWVQSPFCFCKYGRCSVLCGLYYRYR